MLSVENVVANRLVLNDNWVVDASGAVLHFKKNDVSMIELHASNASAAAASKSTARIVLL